MAPKASTKRKAQADDVEAADHDESPDSPKVEKKAKKSAAKDPVIPLDPSLPTNITFPIEIQYPPKAEGTIRLANWNVCGINSCIKKGFDFYVKAENPDILILTETKADKEVDNETIKSRYPYRYWGADPKKGNAGTAILSKVKPLRATLGLPTLDEKTTTGRCVTLEFENHFLLATYTPNASEKLKNMDYKKEWNFAFETYLRQLDTSKPVIWGGDFNCAPTDKDIRHSKQNWNKTPGYTEDEINGYNAQLTPAVESGYEPLVDIWREKHPATVGSYTYYSYRFKCREKGIGWRLDSFILSKRILDKARMCEIRHECYGASDHVPVVLDFEGDL